MTGPRREAYDSVIVGGGIIGLFVAYHLARAGAGPILVVDRGFLSGGASGRNGGGVRQQWATPATVRLARESVQAYRRFGQEFGYNIWFRQGGYIFLAETAEEWAELRRAHAVVTKEGLPARLLGVEQVRALVPGLSVDRVRGASYLSTDGVLYPFPAVWGLYETIQSLGVEVVLGIEATGVSTREGRAEALQLGSRHIRTRWIVNAAGGWSGEFNERAGVPVINVATRHEILATEPLKPFLDPMIVRVRDGLYFSQTMRGEIVGGLTLSHAPGTAQGMPSSARFLRAMAQALTELFPPLGSIGVLRSWSGFYDDTPDGLPILGEDPRLRGFVHANGFGGHGFMLAPSATRRVAQILLGQPTDLDPGLFSPGRFQTVKHAAPVERLQLG